MCKIRIIIQNKNSDIEQDFICEFNNIEIHIIDRPAFCIYTPKNSNGYETILFKYSNLKEDTLEANTDNTELYVIYGKKSGCIYSVSYRNCDTKDWGLLYKKLKSNNDGVRFKTNIQNFFKLVKEVISAIRNEPFSKQ